MIDKEKVIKALESCSVQNNVGCQSCPYFADGQKYGRDFCTTMMAQDALVLLKEQEVRELTMDEWREWKTNPKRDPICKLWEYDTSPIWILNPNDIHEPAFLMGKLKLFTGKPTFEQCKEMKWK